MVGLAFFDEIQPLGQILCQIYFHLYERRASPLWRDLAIDYPRSRLGGMEIFHTNALKRDTLRRVINKLKFRTHDKVCHLTSFF